MLLWLVDQSFGAYSTLTPITDNRVIGKVNFRGTPIPINGSWDENTKHIRFDSPYATFSGNLAIFDEPQIRIRHFILNGRLIMKPPSLQAGEYGTGVATTDRALTGYPVISGTFPPVGVFLTSNILSQLQQNNVRF
ncbi:hypothetical protein ACPOM7_21085 [Peribacillus castrilensis]|uniref:Uncharacterized protein n=2 Tax=Peribacillus TaxID=2675229 RepID=A0AAN2TTK5_9BACI|nr:MULTISPECIES: hypothetical protein [Bacillaceae]MCF7620399.1 hypothetical protein [Peribacillus frigoritolerans]MCP1155952.1 hypothetical protein [Peribacillus frigoritolerans]CEG33143.1 hypothetical protein BN1180_03315 [Peribacillus simplex]